MEWLFVITAFAGMGPNEHFFQRAFPTFEACADHAETMKRRGVDGYCRVRERPQPIFIIPSRPAQERT